MRRTSRIPVAVLLSCLWACGEGGGGSPQTVLSSGLEFWGEGAVIQQSYANGHPIVVTTSDPQTLAMEADIVRIVNDHRVAIGRNSLVPSTAIADVARAHSGHMILHDFFAHDNPEGDSPGARLTKGGVSWTLAGENLAADYSTPEEVFGAWMNSPSHRQNLEHEEWSYTGVGFAYDPSSRYQSYWTQDFARP